MTIRHLKIYVTVYQTCNITRAAEQLHMTQPSVTRAIQELEHYYGVKLFERINRRLFVTESGKQFYPQALHIVDSLDSMEKSLRNWDEFGTLRVGATITLGTVLLPQVVAAFQEKHPNLQIKVLISNGKHLEEGLLDNRLDIALLEGGIVNPHLNAEPFGEDRLVLIMHPENPLAGKEKLFLSDLRDCRFLMREKGSVGRSFLDDLFAVHGIPLSPLWESTSTHAIIQGVKMNLGISILPERLVGDSILEGKVVTKKVEDVSFQRTNYIVSHKNKYLTKSAKEFITICHNFSNHSSC